MTSHKRVLANSTGILVALMVAVLAVLPAVAHESRVGPTERPGRRQFYDRGLLMVPAAAFSVMKPYPPGVPPFRLDYTVGRVHGGYTCMAAPLYLPRGARLREVYASLYDNDYTAGNTARVYVYRSSNYSPHVDVMAFLETAVNSTAVQIISDPSVGWREVESPTYAYYAAVCMDSSSTGLYSLRIYYDTHLYLPAVIKKAGI